MKSPLIDTTAAEANRRRVQRERAQEVGPSTDSRGRQATSRADRGLVHKPKAAR